MQAGFSYKNDYEKLMSTLKPGELGEQVEE